MSNVENVCRGIYLIGGGGISNPEDAAVFVVDFDGELVMIDAGAGKSSRILVKNIEDAGLDPQAVSTLILTHCHVDHIGSALYFKESLSLRIVAHDLDADAIETGDPYLTAATWYNTILPRTPIDKRLKEEHEILYFNGHELHCIHTPGHTPGSISLYIDRDEKRILFGQDIHGPFSQDFGSDIMQWRESMQKLLDLRADILCEGHFGIFKTGSRVEKYIRDYLDQYASY